MPIIREYNQQLNAPNRPISQSADPRAAGAAGRGMQALGGGIQDVGGAVFDAAEQHEQSQLQVDLAQTRADLTAKMQRAKETGEAADPEYVKYATEAAQETAAKLADKMTTRRGVNAARVNGAQLAASVQTQAIHDNAFAIGEEAKNTALETQNINRNTLANSPQQFTAILGETRQHIDSLTHIDANVRERMRIEAEDGLAASAIQGVIRTRSPEEAKQLLDAGHMDGFLSADSKRHLYAEADQAIRAREAEATRLERQQKLLDEKEYAEIGKDFVAKMNSPNGNQLSTKEIVASKLPWQMQEHFIRETKDGPSKVDHALANRLLLDMYREEGDPRKITKPEQLLPYVNKGIDLTTWDHLNRELEKAPVSKDFGRAAATAKMAFQGSPIGRSLPDTANLAFYNWSADLREKIDQYRAEGKDVRELFSREEGARESFLNPKFMASYLKTTNMLIGEKAMEGAPKVGDVVQHGTDKFKFKGGNPADKNAWEKVP